MKAIGRCPFYPSFVSRTWFTAVLVQDNQVCYIVGLAGINNLLHDVSSTVDTLRVGEDKTHLFGELLKTTAGIAGGCDQDLGVVHSSTGVFIINVSSRGYQYQYESRGESERQRYVFFCKY